MERDSADAQRKFYDTRPHDHLQPQVRDAYAARLVSRLVEEVGIHSGARVLEVGAGFGRFTFDLLDHCESVVALDLSQVALSRLALERDGRGISAQRCQPLCADLQRLDEDALEGSFDFVVGFFILHHLPDFPQAIARLVPFMRPKGRMVFIEPNRRNLLFAAQVAFCKDMTWSEEKGMFSLSARGVERAHGAAGLASRPTRRFGFFPPQIFNRFPLARRVEFGIERARILEPLLPFLLLSAEKTGHAGDASS